MDLPDWLNKEAWADFIQHRIEIKKPLKPLSAKKNMNVLEKQKNLQQEIVDNCIKNEWRGLFNITEKVNVVMPQACLPKTDVEWISYGIRKNQPARPGEPWPKFKGRMKAIWEVDNVQ